MGGRPRYLSVIALVIMFKTDHTSTQVSKTFFAYDLIRIKESSTNKRRETERASLQTLTPMRLPCSSSMLDNRSAHRRKRFGDREYP
jgi:hypothetical protein